MPELPEVETVRRGLAPHLEGRRLARVTLRRPDLRIPFPDDFAARLSGRRIERLDRRAKYLLAHCDDGAVVIMHLGMSGRFTVITAQDQPKRLATFVHEAPPARPDGSGPHDHVILETDEGTRIIYTDHRRFGLMTLSDGDSLNAHRLMAGLGLEPLGEGLTAHALVTALAGRHTPLKAALLDQRIIAGLGNIYVCEVLYRARLSPRRSAHTVGRVRAAALVSAIRHVLTAAIEAGGSTLRDYAHADGALGYFQHAFKVYGREGEPCPDRGCGPVQRIVQANRSTFFCPRCQR
ncbi:MAG: bifunctional DNA-formamidopyrimidine glycosylase/DNA-(apurinic or apyrimidinic site) lyase [Alphaproteobacteria bacterium]